MSYTLIERKELTEAASSIEFTAIPQFYTDLVLNVSSRTDGAGPDCLIRPNGSTSNMSGRRLRGNGSNVLSSIEGGYLENSVSTDTASTFSNGTAYFSNYSGSTFKSFSTDAVRENNATDSRQAIMANLWSDTAPITSITIVPSAAVNFVAGSTFSLYGINRQQAIGKPKAIGGAITFANGYWYHRFNGSGSFYALENLTVDALIVAGGGGGGSLGAGGGAGGMLVSSSQNIAANSSTQVVVGSGGNGSYRLAGVVGSDSYFGSNRAFGGGGGGSNYQVGTPGGSGGGATWSTSGYAGTSGQGNAGGAGGSLGSIYPTGGGGGAGSAGVSGAGDGSGTSGDGGAGLPWSGTYYAGGGGGGIQSRDGGSVSSLSTSGGIGGGGNGGIQAANGTFTTNPTSGSANTGGGGGGTGDAGTAGNGGSGIVIVRYLA
jgi:hypothetical protein